MEIVLLSGGSGKSLWPLSNDTRSKQFLKFLHREDGSRESMLQRIVRQLKESSLDGSITVATSVAQRDAVTNQLGEDIAVVTEPDRRDTFSAIALASAFLKYEKGCSNDEVVVVMPCDSYVEREYFDAVSVMANAVAKNVADLVLIGIEPKSPSVKYGYILPNTDNAKYGTYTVEQFIEKPDISTATAMIDGGALWNGGLFAFRIGYMIELLNGYLKADSFEMVRSQYELFPKNSFDYEVVERAKSVAVVPFSGVWKDLGTWNAITDKLHDLVMGNVMMDNEATNTHVINELELPIMCMGVKDLVIAASCDGILISRKSDSDKIKGYADKLHRRPMYEKRRWGEYKVIDMVEFSDGHKALTKQLIIKAGKGISYQIHRHREEVWTFIDGRGLLVIDGKISEVGRGDIVHIKRGMLHAVKAITDLQFIEVQSGEQLVEDDIERYPFEF